MLGKRVSPIACPLAEAAVKSPKDEIIPQRDAAVATCQGLVRRPAAVAAREAIGAQAVSWEASEESSITGTIAAPSAPLPVKPKRNVKLERSALPRLRKRKLGAEERNTAEAPAAKCMRDGKVGTAAAAHLEKRKRDAEGGTAIVASSRGINCVCIAANALGSMAAIATMPARVMKVRTRSPQFSPKL